MFQTCLAELPFATFCLRADKATQTSFLIQVTPHVDWQRALSPRQPPSQDPSSLHPAALPSQHLASMLANSGKKGMDKTRWLFVLSSLEHHTKRTEPKLLCGPSLTAKEDGENVQTWTVRTTLALVPAVKWSDPEPRSRGKGRVDGMSSGSFHPQRKIIPIKFWTNTARPCLGPACFQLSHSAPASGVRGFLLRHGPRGSREKWGKLGRGVTPHPVGNCSPFGNGEEKIFFLFFGCMGRQCDQGERQRREALEVWSGTPTKECVLHPPYRTWPPGPLPQDVHAFPSSVG